MSDEIRDEQLKAIAEKWIEAARMGCVDALECALKDAWQAASSQQTAPVAVPDGWKLVPVEPSIAACIRGADASGGKVDGKSAAKIYAAMLAAANDAPASSAQEPVTVEVMRFQLKHPASGETHTVEFTRAKVADGMEDVLYEKLSTMVCQCDGHDDCECADYIYDFDLIAAPPAAEQPDTARAILTDEDMRRLRRFQEICEDSDAGGHDLPKEAVKRLEHAGALRSCGFGRHEITLFGDYLLGKESV